MEAVIGVTYLQAKKRQGLPATPEARQEARQDPPLEPAEGAGPCPHLDFGLLASRTMTQ